MPKLNLERKLQISKSVLEEPNLCHRFTKEDLQKLSRAAKDGYDRDKNSRAKWEKRYESAMDLAMQVQKAKDFPWPNAANVVFPLVTIAALQFAARAYPSLIQGTDLVRYRVRGDDPEGQLLERATRIGKHMSWQLLEEDEDWEEQQDRLLVNLAIVGTTFKKSYFDTDINSPIGELVQARDLVCNYWAKSLAKCPRKTHIIELSRNEIYERAMDGRFRKRILDEEWFNGVPETTSKSQKSDNRQGQVPPSPSDEDTAFKLHEQHCVLDLDGDGYAEPYVLTYDEKSQSACRLVARWDREEDVERIRGRIARIKATEHFTKYSFIPAPDGGLMDVGFGILLGPLNESVNTGINQLLDAGTMANANGGFYGRGVKMRGGNMSFSPFEWRRVECSVDDIRKGLYPLPVKEPSNVVFQLISLLIEYTQQVSGATDAMVGKNPGQNTPAETSRTMTEQGMQVYSSIYKRVWRCTRMEFRQRYDLNAKNLPTNRSIKFGEKGDKVHASDYIGSPNNIAPVADPNIVSASMRLWQAEQLSNRAHSVNGYDQDATELEYLRALRIDSPDRFYKGVKNVPPLPNPKLQIEQLKAQVATERMKHEREKWIAHLQVDAALNQAKIENLRAQSAKLVADIGGAHSAQQIEAFEVAIKALESHNQAINERIQTLSQMRGEDEQQGEAGGNNGGRVPGVAPAAGNGGVPASDQSPNMGAQGGAD